MNTVTIIMIVVTVAVMIIVKSVKTVNARL